MIKPFIIIFALLCIAFDAYWYFSSEQPTIISTIKNQITSTLAPLLSYTKQSTATPILDSAVNDISDEVPILDENSELFNVKDTDFTPEPIVKKAILLPSLDNSDALVLDSALQFSKQPSYPAMLISKDMIRNFVVFIDNFSRGELLTHFSSLKGPSKRFFVEKEGDIMYLSKKSYQRYDNYARIINTLNSDFLVSQYNKLSPLFDAAYQEIGYPENSFTETLIAAIDNVLNAPIIEQRITLILPSVMYKFSDPALEALPETHRLLLRMGPKNTLKIQHKLQQIQHTLITRQQ